MYEAHFGLNARPFAETADPGKHVALGSHCAALRRLRYGLEHAGGPVLIHGRPGSGKTLAARVLAAELGWPSSYLGFTAMPVSELLAWLAGELSGSRATGSGTGTAESLRIIQESLRALGERGERLLLIVDEAHLIDDPSAFESLRMLSNYRSHDEAVLAIALVGCTEVLLKMPASLEERLAARVCIGPLSLEDAQEYLRGRLRAAGASHESELFDQDCVRLLHYYSDGIPRRLNRLADLTLLIAFAREQQMPDPQDVEMAAHEAGYLEAAA